MCEPWDANRPPGAVQSGTRVDFATFRFERVFEPVCYINMVGDCFDMLISGKPVFKASQCHITLPTKLPIPPLTENLYFSKYSLICPIEYSFPCRVMVLRRTHDLGVVGSSLTSSNHSVRYGMISNQFYHQVFIRLPPYTSYCRTPSSLLAAIFFLYFFFFSQ